MAVIGEEKSERLNVTPAQFRVLVKASEASVPGLRGPGRAGAGAVAADRRRPPDRGDVTHVVVSRFGDHQPLYRQAQIIARQGVVLDRSRLAFWGGYGAAEVAPVVSGFNLVVTAIILRNTRYLERAAATLRQTENVPDNLLARLSPLGWEHVTLTGDYIWAAGRALGLELLHESLASS